MINNYLRDRRPIIYFNGSHSDVKHGEPHGSMGHFLYTISVLNTNLDWELKLKTTSVQRTVTDRAMREWNMIYIWCLKSILRKKL